MSPSSSIGQPGNGRYAGRAGTTQRSLVHVACPCGELHAVEVVVSIDAARDPELARALLAGRLPGASTCAATGAVVPIERAVVFHEPERGALVLVLPPSARSREIEERIAWLRVMDEDPASIPAYARDFSVAYGGDGLAAVLARPGARAAGRWPQATRPREVSRPDPAAVVELDEETATGAVTRVVQRPDVEVERWVAAGGSQLRRMADDEVRVAVRAGRDEARRLLREPITARVLLRAQPSYPLLLVALAPDGALERGEVETWVCFDVDDAVDRALLAALGRRFRFELEVFDEAYVALGRRWIEAPLADELRRAQGAALEHLRGIAPAERSLAAALADFAAAPGPEVPTGEALALDTEDLSRADGVRRALGAVAAMSEPQVEDILVRARRGSLATWRARRRAVLERAGELGLWVGPRLADLAVAEGLAPSRRELVIRARRQFTHLLASRGHGLDDDAVAENWRALRAEAAACGVTPDELAAPRAEPIASDADPVASGTIGAIGSGPTGRVEVVGLASAALIALLGDRVNRLPAAVELARSGEPAAIEPVFAALADMGRAEAGRVLGAATGFGRAAAPQLLACLGSRKGFVRQGAALALAVLGDRDALDAVSALLLAEPTEIWREVARALGEAGAPAAAALAARIEGAGPDGHERLAWALAHVAARGARAAVDALVAGPPAIAEVARRAAELVEVAQRDQLVVLGEQRDQTVNRAFSRHFFEAMAAPAVEVAAGSAVDLSAPAMLLDDADVLEAADLDDRAARELS